MTIYRSCMNLKSIVNKIKTLWRVNGRPKSQCEGASLLCRVMATTNSGLQSYPLQITSGDLTSGFLEGEEWNSGPYSRMESAQL